MILSQQAAKHDLTPQRHTEQTPAVAVVAEAVQYFFCLIARAYVCAPVKTYARVDPSIANGHAHFFL